MNNISMLLGDISLKFAQPLFLLVILGGMILAVIPYFRMKKEKRRTRNRIVSMILHALILTLASMVLAGFSIHEEGIPIYNETYILIDVSDSTYDNSEAMAKYANGMIEGCGKDDKVGVIVFGAGEPVVYKKLQSKPSVNVNELLRDYWDNPPVTNGFILTTGTDIENALKFTQKSFENKDLHGSRIIILTDGMETDGSFESTAKSLANSGVTIDAVYFKPQSYDGTKEMQITNFSIDDQSPEPGQSLKPEVTIKSHDQGSVKINIYDFGKGESVDYSKLSSKEPIVSNNVTVKNEEETFTLGYFALTSSGVHTLVAELVFNNEADDAVNQNNYYLTYAVVSNVSNKILIIDGSTGSADSAELVNLLDKNTNPEAKYEVEVKKPSEAPSNLSDYGEVILVNCATQNATPETKTLVNNQGGSFLPNGYDVTLNNYIANGGGLLTTGGDKTYYNGGMYTGKYQDFLPISVKPQSTGSKAVVICIDYSSGMGTGEGGGKFPYNGGSYTRIELVKMGLQKALDNGAFGENDYIGILAFGGKARQTKMTGTDANGNTQCNPYVLLNITNCYNVMDIQKAFDYLDNSKYMSNTEWRLPMETAASMLNKFTQAETKHMLFITDGAGDKTEGESSGYTDYVTGSWKKYGPSINDYDASNSKCYTGYMYDKYGITTSTILINNNYQTVKDYVKKMAVDGGGIQINKETGKETGFADCTAPDQIAEAVEEACKNIPSKIINDEDDYNLTVSQLLNTMTGVTDEQLPVLKIFNGSTVKYERGAYSLLDTATDSIYAEWKYKGGKVGSIMTDITDNSWSNGLLSGEGGKKIVKYMVDSCFKESIGGLPTDMTISFEQQNFKTKITAGEITNPNVAIMESYYHEPGSGIDPSIDSSIDTLCPEGAEKGTYDRMNLVMDTYSSSFYMKKEGLYTIAFLRLDSENGILDDTAPYYYTTFSYSKEYDTFYDDTELFTRLGDVCALTGGNVYMGSTDDYDGLGEASGVIGDADMDKDTNPQSTLMVLALILFILDVIVRKFNFKWPHEWFKKKDPDAI